VGFVVDKTALGQVFPRVLRFSHVNFIPPVLHYKENRKKLIIFIIGLHSKPQGCGSSVASAVGPFTTKKNYHSYTALSVVCFCEYFKESEYSRSTANIRVYIVLQKLFVIFIFFFAGHVVMRVL
jgi:hypothetical protein